MSLTLNRSLSRYDSSRGDASQSELSRRDLAKIVAASLAGLCCSQPMARLLAAAEGKRPPRACIMLWMPGAPSQLETLDPKPGHANGGPTKAISTAVPGIELAENLPLVAAQMRHCALIRSMKTREGDHARAAQLMQTGFRPMGSSTNRPVLGSIVAHRLTQPDATLPGFVSISSGQSNSFGSGYLGAKYSPLVVSGESSDPSARANLTIENLDVSGGKETLAQRQLLLGMVRGGVPAQAAAANKHSAVYDAAIRMIETKGQGAFNLSEESDALRDAYGRSRFGQGCLLARRLVERGVPFVEVTLDSAPGGNWDSHVNNFESVAAMCKVLDPAWSTLITDLRDRGLLDSTLVVWMGEFGRTPKINPAKGRDHFPDAWSVALSGGKFLNGGQVIGKTNAGGTEVVDRATSSADLMATLLSLLGIDPASSNMDGDRPMPLIDNGHAIKELIA